MGILTESFYEQQLTEGSFSNYIDYHLKGYSPEEMKDIRKSFDNINTIADCEKVEDDIQKVKDKLHDNVGGRFKDLLLSFTLLSPLGGIIKQSIRDVNKAKELPELNKFLNSIEHAVSLKKKELSTK